MNAHPGHLLAAAPISNAIKNRGNGFSFLSAALPKGLQRLGDRMVREPLFHFLAVGLILFVGYGVLNPGETEGRAARVIRVDDEGLLRFVQFRSKLFDGRLARASLAGLSAAERASLVKEFVREQALYREALAWGLDREDYVVRRRLVQTMEFAARNSGAAAKPLSDAALRKYYEAHRARYAAPPAITFTHNFFSAELHGRDEARRLATEGLATLADGSDRPLGDRFLYLRSYRDGSPDMLASQFGSAMTERLFSLPVEPARWQGPFESALGFHLVRVTRLAGGGIRPFERVRDLVLHDAAEEQSVELQKQVLDRIVAGYSVKLESNLLQVPPQ